MIHLKKQDIGFLKLFTLYQIVEILVWFAFSFLIMYITMKTYNNTEEEINHFAWLFEWYFYGLGFAIQYVVIIILWIGSVFMDTTLLRTIKITLYCNLDLIITLFAPMAMFFFFSNDKAYNSFIYWILVLALLVICSKVMFFKYYKKRFGLRSA